MDGGCISLQSQLETVTRRLQRRVRDLSVNVTIFDQRQVFTSSPNSNTSWKVVNEKVWLHHCSYLTTCHFLGIMFLTILLLLVGNASADKFAVVGDYGKDSTGEKSVSEMIKTWDSVTRLSGILTVGDNNYDVGSSSTINKNVGKYYGTFLSSKRFYPTPGNHDWGLGNLNAYCKYFGVRSYYKKSFEYVDFFMLDSDPHEPDGVSRTSKQGMWLKSELKTSNATWKIVLFHHPPFSSGSHGNSAYMNWPFFEWGANLVISGHDHDYERFSIKGNTYIVNGMGGAEIRGFGKIIPGSIKRYNKKYGAMLLDITTRINIKFISIDNVVRDNFTITITTQ